MSEWVVVAVFGGITGINVLSMVLTRRRTKARIAQIRAISAAVRSLSTPPSDESVGEKGA